MKVILQHGGKWLRFGAPERVLRTDRQEEVLPLMREAEASVFFVAGFVSYEAAAAFDSALSVKPSASFPLLCLGLFSAPEVMDSIAVADDGFFELGAWKASVSKSEFVERIEQIKAYIAEGATYQVNYTYRLQSTFAGDAWSFFCAFVEAQQTAYAAYVELDDLVICSASPELFFSLSDGRVVARPMKGTAPRGTTFEDDGKLAEALRASEKDRAENIMIVDMLRNDIGRVARAGSVQVPSSFEVEKYPTCWQMTSTVVGETSASPVEVFSNLFPCASITGAPKAKTMELIQGLETAPRKIYTGSIGFMTPQGEACFNVAIRTALIQRAVGRVEYGVGGGIVWDSDAEAEYEETLTKARVIMAPRPDFRLLETMRWGPDEGIYLLNEHVQRMAKSAAYFDVPLDRYAIEEALAAVTKTLEEKPYRLRLLLDRAGGVEVQPVELEEVKSSSIRVAMASEPVRSQELFLYHKTTYRPMYQAALEAHPEGADVILWNERGEVTESCFGNVVARIRGRLVTPPVSCGLLAGTFRAALLRENRIAEQVISKEELLAAAELFVVNSVREWQRGVWSDA